VLAAAGDGGEPLKIFGTDYPTPDGTCVRDYIHVDDLVDAHILALNAIQPGRGNIYNLGSESGFSVREVIRACEKVAQKTIPVIEYARRPGDPAVLVASSAKITRELGWKRKYPELETIISHGWGWHQSHPPGYASIPHSHDHIERLKGA
jgi:UDP-glucose 4-epimerase